MNSNKYKIMYKADENPYKSEIFSNFASVVGIKSCENVLLAIVRLKKDDKDYLAQYFRVRPIYFEATLSHLKKSSSIIHPNVQRVHSVLSNEKSAEFFVLYSTSLSLVERIESDMYLSDAMLSALLSHIQLGLLAQKAHLASENHFVHEFNVFQCNDQFTIGVGLPLESHTILLPLNLALDSSGEKIYTAPWLLPPELIGNTQNKIKTNDVFALGILALRTMGKNQLLEQKLNTAHQLPTDKKLYEAAIKDILDGCSKSYYRTTLECIERMLGYSERPPIEKVVPGMSVGTKIHSFTGLSTFHSFCNGGLVEKGPQSSGHHGKSLYAQRSSVLIRYGLRFDDLRR